MGFSFRRRAFILDDSEHTRASRDASIPRAVSNAPFSRDSESSERSAPLRKTFESRLNGKRLIQPRTKSLLSNHRHLAEPFKMSETVLVRYGRISDVARFHAAELSPFERGRRVVVRTHRGIEVGAERLVRLETNGGGCGSCGSG